MATLTILGAGRMGTALCTPLLDRGHDVCLVGTHLDGPWIEELRRSGVHPGLGTALPDGATYATIDGLAAALHRSDGVVLGVSSAGIGWSGQALAGLLAPGARIAMVTKGLHWSEDRFATMAEVFASTLPGALRATVAPVSISGPCLAGELARRVETCVVMSGTDGAQVEWWADLATTPYYHARAASDPRGNQLATALKNAYAIAMGIVAGVRDVDEQMAPRQVAMQSTANFNAEAATFAQSVLEMDRLVGLAGGEARSVMGLSGVGDLLVTCHGRNHRLGAWLGAGLPLEEAVGRMEGASLEGVDAVGELARALPSLEVAGRIGPAELPLARHLVDVLAGRSSAAIPYGRFDV
jgi:glycerol-3-phosphate dehydrogenase (NAD(P)+)